MWNWPLGKGSGNASQAIENDAKASEKGAKSQDKRRRAAIEKDNTGYDWDVPPGEHGAMSVPKAGRIYFQAGGGQFFMPPALR